MNTTDAEPTGPAGPPVRGRGAVAASILAVLLIGGYFAASSDLSTALSEFAINAAVLVLAFWFPAMRLDSPGAVLRSWRSLVPWLLAWTLVWDLASSGILGERDLLQEWWLVYPSGVLVLVALLLLHGWVIDRVHAAGDDG